MFKESNHQISPVIEQFNPKNQLSPEILDILKQDKRNYISSKADLSLLTLKTDYQKIAKDVERIFGQALNLEDFKNMFSLEELGIKSETLIFRDENNFAWSRAKGEAKDSLKMTTFFYDENKNGEKVYAGFSREAFCIDPKSGQRTTYVHNINLNEPYQRLGLGMELTLQREKFCQEQGIEIMRGQAETYINNIGAYVCAVRGGCEFADKAELERIKEELKDFAYWCKIDEKALEALTRPNELARFSAPDNEGNPQAIGKEFLSRQKEGVYWDYKQKIPLDGLALEERLAYLKSKGREDLVKKYYPVNISRNE